MALILDDIVQLPFTFGMQVLQALAKQVDRETLSTEISVREKIMEIQMAFESGDLPKDEYDAHMKFLRERLVEVEDVEE
jgi:hypothetical protein